MSSYFNATKDQVPQVKILTWNNSEFAFSLKIETLNHFMLGQPITQKVEKVQRMFYDYNTDIYVYCVE